MSKVKIQGNASGTGVLTVTAPNTSTDRTITLPDATGTLLNSDGSGANLTGLPNGSQLDHSGTKKIEAVSTGAQIQNRLEVITPNDSSTHLVQRLGSTDGSYGYVDLELVSPNSTAAGLPRLDLQVGNSTVASFLRGGGITFNGDTAAANALDDYEEGNHSSSWTTGNSGSITMGRNSMGYVKVGKVVTITGEFDVGSVSSPVGGVRVSLPFAIASHTSERNMSFVTRAGMYHVPHHEDNPPLFIGHGGTSIIEGIYERDDNSFVDYNPQAGETIWLCFSYFTDS